MGRTTWIIWNIFNIAVLFIHSEIGAERVKREKGCRGGMENGAGFCLTADRLMSQCIGRMAVAQQSRECAVNEWCCQRSGRRFLASLQRGVGELAGRTVDAGPCGHGSVFKGDQLFRGQAVENIRRFARIYNGVPMDIGDVCWLAAIYDLGNTTLGIPMTFLCAGAIVNSTHILTAAHCVDRLLSQTEQLFVLTGVTDASPGLRSVHDPCVQQFSVDQVLIPQGYDPDTLDRDFAFLQVRGTIKSNDCTCRACSLDRAISSPSAVTCWAAGFGSTKEGGSSSLQLTKTIIDFVARDRCEVLLGGQLGNGKRFQLASSAICAGDAQRGGLCTNDGGAPLTCIIEGRHTLVGIGSWAVDCSRLPSVFSSLISCPLLLSDINAQCSSQEAILHASAALTSLPVAAAPTCGVPGNNELDPFGLANQKGDKQTLDVGRIKRDIKNMTRQTTSSLPFHLPNGDPFQMMSNDSIPQLVDDDTDEVKILIAKQGPVLVPANGSTFFPAETIVGGTTVPLNEICWQVLISSGCGGSIISDQYILTAAHCVTVSGTTTAKDPRSLRVVLGATQSPVQFPLNDCQELRSVRQIIVHEDYFIGNDTTEWVSNDIALLELDRPIDFRNPCVCKICLQNSQPASGETCTISGFGCQIPTKPSSPCEDTHARALQRLNVIMPGDDICSSFFPDLPSDLITCSASKLQHAPCFGDSGGPIVCYNSQRSSYYQAGITSFAIFPDGVEKCGLSSWNFQYYTKLASFIQWIKNFVPDIMVTESGSFTFHASFNVDLGQGIPNLITTSNQVLPAV